MVGNYRRAVQKLVGESCRLQQAKARNTRRVCGPCITTSMTTQVTATTAASCYREYGTSAAQVLDRVDLIDENNEVRSPYADIYIPNISLSEYCFQKMDENSAHLGMMNMETGERYTWGDIKDSARRVASALTKHGYRKGDVICIFKTNSPEFTIMFLAVSSIGGVITTANPQYHAGELKKQLEDSAAKAIFTMSSLVNIAKDAAKGNPRIKDIITLGEDTNCMKFSRLLSDNGRAFPDNVQVNAAEDVCVIPYSSGTTGLPKGVMLTHTNIISNIYQLGRQTPLISGDRNLTVLPFYHIYGLVVIQFSAIRDNFSLHTMSSFDPKQFLENLQNQKITCLNAVPPMVLLLAKYPAVEDYDLSNLRVIMCGAAPLGADLSQQLVDRFPDINILQGYGMTETSPVTHGDVMPCRLGTIGHLLVNTKAKIVDLDNGDNLGPGEVGEVCVMGPQVMKGYRNNQAATDSMLYDGWLHTGDIGMYNEEGVFTITDRLKELIKYKGFQVPPAELESVLLTHPDIQDAGVIGVPDDYSGELPRAYVVLKAGKTKTEKDIKDYVANIVAQHKKLRGGVAFVKEIPKNPSGKILRRQLKDDFKRQSSS